MQFLRSFLNFGHRAIAFIIRSITDFFWAYWKAVYHMVEQTPFDEERLRRQVGFGWYRSIEEAKRKINFRVALGFFLMSIVFLFLPLVFLAVTLIIVLVENLLQ